jgi:hypothetical protein
MAARIKPESEEALLNKYAFADHRVDNRDLNEPDNEVEKKLFKQIASYVGNPDNKIDKDNIGLIKRFLSNGEYSDLFIPTSSDVIYRGMAVHITHVEKMLSKKQLEELHKRGTLTVDTNFTYLPRSNMSSWSKSRDSANMFAKSDSYENYSVLLMASIKDNDNKNMLDLEKFYSSFYDFIDLKNEKEILVFGNLHVNKIMIKTYKKRKNAESFRQSYFIRLDVKKARQDIHSLIDFLFTGVAYDYNVQQIYMTILKECLQRLQIFLLKELDKKLIKMIQDEILSDAMKIDDMIGKKEYIIDQFVVDGLALNFSLDREDFNKILKNFLTYLIDQPDDVLIENYKKLFYVENYDNNIIKELFKYSLKVVDLDKLTSQTTLNTSKKKYYAFLIDYFYHGLWGAQHVTSHEKIIAFLTLVFEDKWFRNMFRLERAQYRSAVQDPKMAANLITDFYNTAFTKLHWRVE